MVITRIEHVPQLWDEERDGAFFRLMHRAFSADFLYGASVLLAGNDLDAPEPLVAAGRRSDARPADAARSDARPAKASV